MQQGWVKGFPDGSFRPDQPVTRAEMALIVGYASKVAPKIPAAAPFTDVSERDWYAPMLYAMKLNGSIEGAEGNLYKPKQRASRAEFTVLLYRVLL
ncbi:Endo-1,4-beta-xylanase A precursor [compost metagenome]